MIKNFIYRAGIFLSLMISANVFGQNALLVNFGTNSCSSSPTPAFSLIKNPLDATSSSVTSCSLVNQLDDVFSVFIAYNPKNNKIYVADISSGIDTKIWVLDVGLPSDISCPPVIPATPDYSYSYISNNFEFDNNGDLWSFSNYDPATGVCSMDKFDVNDGTIINSRLLQFPAGNFPTAITSGDLTILPNGRMFATLGSSPSRLYEIHNYSSTDLNATATFLTIIPQDCFGIAYLNGLLELAGTDFSGNCYYFEYDINTNLLSAAKTFQAGQLPVDNTSITPSLGVTKQLVSAVKVNANTADIVYEVYVTNLGNVALNNINVSDDLAAVFGAANVSNVNIAFVPGSNAGGLLLNNFYDGKTSKNMLVAGQTLKNNTSSNTDYFFKIRLSCRVTNLNSGTSYLNSAVGNATIGGGGNSALVSISDSSNDGAQTAADPNLNGNASEMGENVPTPFNFATLPVKFTSINADWIDRSSAKIRWSVATPTINSDIFEIEFSENGTSWEKAGVINISDANKGNYEFVHRYVKPAILYYRIIETDLDGKFTYSNIVVLQPANRLTATVYPSPANEQIFISIPGPGHGNVKVQLFDAMAKQVILQNTTETSTIISTKHLPQGAYILKLTGAGIRVSRKILLVH